MSSRPEVSLSMGVLMALALVASVPDAVARHEQGGGEAAPHPDPILVEHSKVYPRSHEYKQYFGDEVDMSEDTLVVSAFGEDPWGAVYVFNRIDGVWIQEARITLDGSDASNFDFGNSVAIEGDTLVVGADVDWSGAAFVFTRSNGVWTEQAKLVPSDSSMTDIFGCDVAIEGDTIVVGAYGDEDFIGSAYIFTQVEGEWLEETRLTASDRQWADQFGYSVEISGDLVVV